MAFDPFGLLHYGGDSSSDYSSIPAPERNPAFHDVGFSAPIQGSIYGSGAMASDPVGDVFGAVSSGIRGIGSIFTSGLDTAADITRSYNNYDRAANPRRGIDTTQLLMIGGGILLVALVLK